MTTHEHAFVLALRTASPLYGNIAGAGGAGGGLTGTGGTGGNGGGIAVAAGPSRVRNATVAGNGVATGGAPGSAAGTPGAAGVGGGLFVQSTLSADDMQLQNTIDAIPARDGGCLAADQRGVRRPQGRVCDIGADEFAIPRIAMIAPFQGAFYERGSWIPARFRCDEGGVVSTIATCTGIVVMRLLDGPFAGKYVYVAEHITVSVRAGQTVSAGQQIATLYAGYPWSESGWASGPGPEALAMADGHWCHTCADVGDWSTIEGRNMNALLLRLGAPSGLFQPIPNQSMPPGWPTWPG